jgi:hypothetical protein
MRRNEAKKKRFSILSIDPGREKCGVAIINNDKNVLFKSIIATARLRDTLKEMISEYSPETVIMGNGTFSKKVKPLVEEVINHSPVILVDEKHSTERGKLLYYKENPPRGLWKLIPVTLQVPEEPYDDFAAIILALDYLENKS